MKSLILLFSITFFPLYHVLASSRIKDLVTVKGVRENPLIGYGLVIGLNGTGDGGGEITDSSLKRMFQKLGLNPQQEIGSKNVAAVIVTGTLPAFSRVGQKIDITISSIGDASSLAGGTLLITPLKAGDGNIYAVAGGPLSIGGLKQGAKFATTGKIPSGATIEKEQDTNFNQKKSLRLSLNNSDFTTAYRIQLAINTQLGGKYAFAKDSSTVDIIVPPHYERNTVELMALIENFRVNADIKAKIIINERTGTIIAGGEIFLHEAAISHGDLTIEIKGGQGSNQNDGQKQRLFHIDNQISLKELVKALNTLGTGPEDLISIFQALKRHGALIGEIELI